LIQNNWEAIEPFTSGIMPQKVEDLTKFLSLLPLEAEMVTLQFLNKFFKKNLCIILCIIGFMPKDKK
jgi:hypothetical protein